MSFEKDLSSPSFGQVLNWLPLFPLYLSRPSVQTRQITLQIMLNELFGLLASAEKQIAEREDHAPRLYC
jgi:hypothetical protein